MHVWLDNFSIFKHSHKFCAAYLQNSYDFEIGGEKCIEICSLTLLIWKSFKLLKLFFSTGNFLFNTVSEKKFCPTPLQVHRNNGPSLFFSSRHVILSIRLLRSVLLFFFFYPGTYIGELFQNPSGSPNPTNSPPLWPQEQKINTISYKIFIYIS